MPTEVYQNQAFSEAQESNIDPTDEHKYEYLDLDARQGSRVPANRAPMEAPAPSTGTSAPKQSTCRPPPWWAWLIIVIAVVLIAAAATAIFLLTTKAVQATIPASTQALQSTAPYTAPSPSPSTARGDVTDCSEVDTSGIYTIVRHGLNVKVYCQVDDRGKFVVIQRREDGSVNFYRNWADYRQGFGDVAGEHWLGNDNIHALTAAGYTRLRIDLVDWDNNKYTVYYNGFWVDQEQDKYRLTLSGFYGSNPPGDSFVSVHNGMQFSTYDQDNDSHESSNCASAYLGAWWYGDCHHANLNGEYNNTVDAKGINWGTWKGYYYSLKKTMMMLTRP